MIKTKPRNVSLQRGHPLARGLVGAWLFYEGGGDVARDVIRRTGDGTVNGATWVMSPGGGALRFVTAGADVSIGVAPPAGSFSFVVRCQSESPTPHGRYLVGVQNSGNNGGRFVRTLNGKFQFEIIQGGTRDANGIDDIVANRWYSVAGVCDLAADQTRIYVDGVLNGTGSAAGITSFTELTNLKIGERPDTNGDTWTGSIEHVYIYDRALADREISALHLDPYQAFRRPLIPTLAAAPVNRTTVRLTWQDNAEDEDGFSIERSTNGVDWSEIGTVAANATQFDDPNAEKGATYYYRVRAFNANGYSDYSGVIEVATAAP